MLLFVLIIVFRQHCETLELNEGHEIVSFKGPPFLQPVHQFKANITTMTSLENTILPGSRFELYLKGVEVRSGFFFYFLRVLIGSFYLFLDAMHSLCFA